MAGGPAAAAGAAASAAAPTATAATSGGSVPPRRRRGGWPEAPRWRPERRHRRQLQRRRSRPPVAVFLPRRRRGGGWPGFPAVAAGAVASAETPAATEQRQREHMTEPESMVESGAAPSAVLAELARMVGGPSRVSTPAAPVATPAPAHSAAMASDGLWTEMVHEGGTGGRRRQGQREFVATPAVTRSQAKRDGSGPGTFALLATEDEIKARGVAQREGVNFCETFSPCPSITSIRMLDAIACVLDWDLCHIDAEQAFVQSELDEVVFIRLPPGCGALSCKVVRLRQSLYGLKQASRTWHYHLMRGMKSLGFEAFAADAFVVRLIESGVVTMVVVIHVDDIFSVGLKSRCDQFVVDLNRGEDRCQAVAEKIVAKFGVTTDKETPMVVGLKLEQYDADEPDVDEPFRSLVGHLMWLANQTRPNVLNAAALHVLMYVRFTSKYGITFQRGTVGGDHMELFANKATERRFVSGALVMFAGAYVMYLCRTQKCVTLSSTEAEYVAMSDGMKEAHRHPPPFHP
ncbi:unnamed protein product [Ectocarpus sp. CCAP 1310/34]|nr:unnamed protein product [Ectocarpus sp. CCAP 1310/34]